MRLLQLEAKNLFSLGDVKLNLKAGGLTLVTGHSIDEGSSNGAGKSSLANKAVLWTLYGLTAGGLKADSVLNRHGKRKARAQVSFIGGDGDSYTVVRERPAKLSLFKGTTNVSAKTAKETQVLIDQALGIDFKTFVQTSFFGQGRNLSYASLVPKEQKAVLEQILPMEEVDKWATYADKQAKELKAHSNKAEVVVIKATTALNVLESQLHRIEAQGVSFEQSRSALVSAAEIKLESIEAPFKTRRDALDIVAEQMEGENLDDLKEQVTTDNARMTALSDERQKVELTLRDLSESTNQWHTRFKYLMDEKASLQDATRCSACLRDYDETTVEAVEGRRREFKKLIKEADLNLKECQKASTYYTKEASAKTEIKMRLDSRLTRNLSRMESFEKYAATRKELDLELEATTAAARAKIEEHKNRENPHLTQAKTLTGDIELAKIEHKEALGAQAEIDRELIHLEFWRDVYGKELKLRLFEDACPFLDSRTDLHLSKLKNEQIHVEFTTIKRLANGTAKEEFNVHVWSETGGTGFDSLSGGEQQMVSFAIGLALADLSGRISGGHSSFLILDEPFSELDARNSESIVEYLTGEIGNGRDTIFLISNEETLKGLVPNRIHVVKQRGITNVEG